MIDRALLLAAAASLTTLAPAQSTPAQPAPADAPALRNVEFLDQYAATNRFRLGNPNRATVTPDGKHILFLRSGPRSFVQDLFVFDVAKGTERVLLTADQLLGGGAETLTPEELARRERMRMASRGITGFDLSQDGRLVLVPLSGRLFTIDLAGALTGKPAPRELTSKAGAAIDPQLSPDATKLTCVREGDVYVTDLASGTETRLTTTASPTSSNGEAEFVAQEEMSRFHGTWWSPDASRLVYQHTDTSAVEMFHIADAFNPGKAPNTWPYPRAGKANAVVTLGVIPAAGGPTVWVEWDRAAYPYLASVRWDKGAPLTILVQSRSQRDQRLLRVDDATGKTTTLLQESDPAWINIAESCPRWTPDGKHFLWLSEQAFPGCDHWTLQLRDASGALVRNLAGKAEGLVDLASFDPDARVAYITATGDDPTQTLVRRVSIDEPGKSEVIAGEGVGTLDGSPSPKGQYGATFGHGHNTWIRSANTLTGRAALEVFRADGSRAGALSSAAEPFPFSPKVEILTLQDRLACRAAIVRPRDFDPARKYPVIDSVYGGPGSNTVSSVARAYVMQQWLADQGFIVVSIDGRGTPKRGRAWERATSLDLISIPLADHADALRALAARCPEIDLDRVGVSGWSFGGYFTAHALMRRPDVYRCGVAGAPVCDWADYDTHYTERYMGLPQEQQDAYRHASVLTYCKDLTRPLLLIHGTADDNVYFLHTLKMTDALERAGRRFEFMPLSGFTHSPQEPGIVRAIQSRIATFFIENLRPARAQDAK